MSKNKYDGRPFHVAMFVSRNKDNGLVEGFKQRTRSFLTQKEPHELMDDFKDFSDYGVKGEMSRFYMSVNDRDVKRIHLDLQHYLIDHQDANLANTERLIASLSMKSGTSNSKKFMFDFDNPSQREVFLFVQDIKEIVKDEIVHYHKTPNGFVVIVDHGFDTRELLDKWYGVELKRDGMEFICAGYTMG